jgi:hypothetical protein
VTARATKGSVPLGRPELYGEWLRTQTVKPKCFHKHEGPNI